MIKFPYEKFKELFELQRKESDLVGQALVADGEREGAGDEFWAQAKSLSAEWKKIREDCYKESDDNRSGTIPVMRLLEDFSYIGEERLIKILLVANIEVCHAEN